MNITWSRAGTAAALAMALAWAPTALAANGPAQGDTSGPAVGTPPTPSGAVQKQTSGPAVGSGAPGVEAKQGTEGGSAPRQAPSDSKSASQK
jgi:hypothetical protein